MKKSYSKPHIQMYFNRHTQGICCIIQLKDGKFATGSFDCDIRIWRYNNDFICRKTLAGHRDSVYCLIELHNRTIASCSWDSTIRIWDLKTYNLVTVLHAYKEHFYTLIQAVNRDLFAGAWNNIIYHWSNKTFKIKPYFNGHLGGVTTLYQLKNKTLASGSCDWTIKLWDIRKHSCIDTLKGHDDHVLKIIQLKDGRIVSASNNGAIFFWKAKEDKYHCVQIIKEQTTPLTFVLQINSMWVISCGNKIKIWDCNTYVCVKTFNEIKDKAFGVTGLDEEGKLLACATMDKVIRVAKLI